VKLSDADLAWLYGLELITALLNPCCLAERLPAARGILITAGEEGAAFCFRSAKGEASGFAPVFKVKVTDTTGAGDAFTAGFIKKLLEREGGLPALAADAKGLKEAVVFASACGAATTTKPGAIAAQPSAAEAAALFETSKGWYNFW